MLNTNKYSLRPDSLPKSTRIGLKNLKRHHKNYIKCYLGFLDDKINVLEVGPGEGHFADCCIENGWGYTGIERSEVLSEQLKSKGLNIINISVPPFPKLKDKFDLVHMDQVLEHMADHNEADLLIKESSRVLKTGGILSIACPNIEVQKFVFYDWDYSHTYPVSKQRLRRILYDNDMKEIYSGYFLNWNVRNDLLIKILRPVGIVFFKLFSSLLIRFLMKSIGLETTRLRIVKNLLDCVVVIAQKN